MTTETASTKDTDAAHAVPAAWVNRIFVSATPVMLRLAFAEQTSTGTVSVRSAVAMSFQDATALRDLLATVLHDIKADIAR